MSTALLLALVVGAGQSIESRTLQSLDEGEGKWSLSMNQRIVANGRVIVFSRDVSSNGTISFLEKEYDMSGAPLLQWQEGYWNDRWNRFESTYGAKGATLNINGKKTASKLPRKQFVNPTALWFWQVQPKVGESVTVTFLAQNVPKTFQIKFTYEGDEEMTLAQKKVKVHRVREDPLGAKGVYTIWWYDDKGMGVKRYHKTTEHEYRNELKAWH